jgi:hypothetical protein
MRYFIVALSASILIITSLIAAFFVPFNLADGNKEPSVFVGISFCGNTVDEAKNLIDRVSTYTNLFVLQSYPISRNETAVKEICAYAVKNELYLIVNLGTYNMSYWPWQFEVFRTGKQLWGNKFLGAYYDDEPGGVQLDYNWTAFFTADENVAYFEAHANSSSPLQLMYSKIKSSLANHTQPEDYNLEAESFYYYFRFNTAFKNITNSGVKTFTSDYSLFWYDYKAGYDVILAQLGWNNSYIKDIDFIRGAARVQNKEWGAIITWKYSQTPYLDSAAELYNQMLMAYQAGAKYIIIFNYPQIEGNPYGTLTDDHFAAIEKFSSDAMASSNIRSLSDKSEAEAVLVLPQNYAWGMRRPDDRIWGFWEPDAKSDKIWDITCKLLLRYRLNLDIVYEDPSFPVEGKYKYVYYWNQTL